MNLVMIIQKAQVVSGFYFTVRTANGEHLATSPHYETDGLCHQAALRLIDGARGGVNIMPVDAMLFRQDFPCEYLGGSGAQS